MKIFVDAYDVDHKPVLGNLDGQSVIRCANYRRSKTYKWLRDTPAEKLSLNGRVRSYEFVNEQGRVLEVLRK